MMDGKLGLLLFVLLLALPTGTAIGQGKGSQQKPVSNPYMVLIRDPVVQRELRLTITQRSKVLAVTNRADGPLWMIRAMPVEKGSPALAKLISTTQVEMKKILSAVQKTRLREIVLRVQGSNAFLPDDVVAYLGLNDEQSTEINSSMEATKKEVAALEQHRKDGEPREKLEPLANKIKEQGFQDLGRVLNEAQRRKLASMRGKEFDTSQLGNIKFKAPELDGAGGWINSQSLRIGDLRGKVVALHFMAYG